jgi:hypothetical protein
MSSPEKDVEALREAHQRLSTYITRFGLVRLSILFITIVSFSGAFDQINASDVRKKRDEIEDLRTDLYRKEAGIEYFKNKAGYLRRQLANLKQNVGPDTLPAQTNQATHQSAPPLSVKAKPAEREPAEIVAPGAWPSQQMIANVLESELKKAGDEQRKAEKDKRADQDVIQTRGEEIEGIYRQAFRVKIPLPGGEIEIDMRKWIYCLPLAFLLSEIYLSTLRKQRRLLGRVGAYRIRQGRVRDFSIFDRLLFSNDARKAPPFAEHPSQLINRLCLACILVLAVYLVVAAKPFWQDWEPTNVLAGLQIALTVIFYLAAYWLFIFAKLDVQVASPAIGLALTKNPLVSIAGNGKRWFLSQLARIKPVISLPAGGLLVLMTLFLATSVGPCSRPHRGYDLVRGWTPTPAQPANASARRNDETPAVAESEKAMGKSPDRKPVYWPGMAGLSQYGIQYPGRVIYIVSLLLALIAPLSLLSFGMRSPPRQSRRWTAWLYAISGSLSIYVLSDSYFSLLALCIQSSYRFLLGLWLLFWFVPIFLWLRFGLSRRIDRRERWPGIRSFLVLAYIPIAAFACVFIVIAVLAEVKGLLAYFIGIHLVSLGCMCLTRASSPARLNRSAGAAKP